MSSAGLEGGELDVAQCVPCVPFPCRRAAENPGVGVGRHGEHLAGVDDHQRPHTAVLLEDRGLLRQQHPAAPPPVELADQSHPERRQHVRQPPAHLVAAGWRIDRHPRGVGRQLPLRRALPRPSNARRVSTNRRSQISPTIGRRSHISVAGRPEISRSRISRARRSWQRPLDFPRSLQRGRDTAEVTLTANLSGASTAISSTMTRHSRTDIKSLAIEALQRSASNNTDPPGPRPLPEDPQPTHSPQEHEEPTHA